jgi:MoaA/NifB/PqqE/SkfB family radical SAM enzyme
LASSLKIDVGCGVQTSVDLDEYFNLYLYYEQKKDIKNALEYLLKYFELNRLNGHVKDRLQFYLVKVNENDPLFDFDENMMNRLKKAISLIQKSDAIREVCQENGNAHNRYMPGVKDNSNLNDAEFSDRKLVLNSTPKQFFIKINGPSPYRFIFDRQDGDYDLFSLKTFRSRFEEKIMPFMSKAEEVIFSGNGEFLLFDEAENILDYFDKNLPCSTKVFTTTGYAFSPAICEKILSLKSRFVINVSFPAFSREYYKVMARIDNMSDILRNLDYLLSTKTDSDRLEVNILFTAAALNIEELPKIVRLAADLKGVNKVICRYASIYDEAQTYLSCYFRQTAANKASSEAVEIAKSMDLKIDILPYFGKNNSQDSCLCRVPWSSIMLDTIGRVFVCEKSSKCIGNVTAKDFFNVWNGTVYQGIRKIFAGKNCPYFNHCIQVNCSANCSTPNNFDAHKAYYTDEREAF